MLSQELMMIEELKRGYRGSILYFGAAITYYQ